MVAVAEVAIKLVTTAELENRFVVVALVKFALVEDKLVIVLEFANKLLLVTFVKTALVAVAFANSAFQRSAEEPSESTASRLGFRFVETEPLTAKPVVVALVAINEVIAPFTTVPLVTNKFVEVVFDPVAFTQVKFVRLRVPAVRLVKAPFVANRLVVVTDVPVARLNVRF